MKISVGTIIGSDFGVGPVVAITEEWVIQKADGCECALHREDGRYWIEVTEHEIGGGKDLAIVEDFDRTVVPENLRSNDG